MRATGFLCRLRETKFGRQSVGHLLGILRLLEWSSTLRLKTISGKPSDTSKSVKLWKWVAFLALWVCLRCMGMGMRDKHLSDGSSRLLRITVFRVVSSDFKFKLMIKSEELITFQLLCELTVVLGSVLYCHSVQFWLIHHLFVEFLTH